MKLLTSYNVMMLSTFVLYILVGAVVAQDDSAEVKDSVPGPSSQSLTENDAENATESEKALTERPEWTQLPKYRDADGADLIVVTAGPDISLSSVRNSMEAKLVNETNKYIDETLEPAASNFFAFTPQEIKKRFLVAGHDYIEQTESPLGITLRQYKQLKFTLSFRKELDDRWKDRKGRFRLGQIGVIAGGVLISLVVIFCCFSINRATRGFYVGRLQFVAVAAILALIISGFFVGRFL